MWIRSKGSPRDASAWSKWFSVSVYTFLSSEHGSPPATGFPRSSVTSHLRGLCHADLPPFGELARVQPTASEREGSRIAIDIVSCLHGVRSTAAAYRSLASYTPDAPRRLHSVLHRLPTHLAYSLGAIRLSASLAAHVLGRGIYPFFGGESLRLVVFGDVCYVDHFGLQREAVRHFGSGRIDELGEEVDSAVEFLDELNGGLESLHVGPHVEAADVVVGVRVFLEERLDGGSDELGIRLILRLELRIERLSDRGESFVQRGLAYDRDVELGEVRAERFQCRILTTLLRDRVDFVELSLGVRGGLVDSDGFRRQ